MTRLAGVLVDICAHPRVDKNHRTLTVCSANKVAAPVEGPFTIRVKRERAVGIPCRGRHRRETRAATAQEDGTQDEHYQPENEGRVPGHVEQARQVARAERDAVEAAGTDAADTGRKPWEAPTLPGGAVAPAARRLAAELGVDVDDVTGTGSGGLVPKDDVRAFADGTATAAKPAAEPADPNWTSICREWRLRN